VDYLVTNEVNNYDEKLTRSYLQGIIERTLAALVCITLPSDEMYFNIFRKRSLPAQTGRPQCVLIFRLNEYSKSYVLWGATKKRLLKMLPPNGILTLNSRKNS
jgi:hypothetical protein